MSGGGGEGGAPRRVDACDACGAPDAPRLALKLIGALCVQRALPAGSPCWLARHIGGFVGGARTSLSNCPNYQHKLCTGCGKGAAAAAVCSNCDSWHACALCPAATRTCGICRHMLECYEEFCDLCHVSGL